MLLLQFHYKIGLKKENHQNISNSVTHKTAIPLFRRNGRVKMNRVGTISGISLIFVLLLSSCATTRTESPISEVQIINTSNPKIIGEQSQASESISTVELLQQVQKVSVITPEGSEMELGQSFWTKQILDKLGNLVESNSRNHTYTYTLILRTSFGTPYVMQIGNEALTIGDTTFKSNILPQIVLGIRGEIGKQLLTDMSIDHLSIFMLDVANHPLDLAIDEAEELSEIIESATLIHETSDLQYPLFPHYVVQILDGDKSVVHLDIIGNNIISIPYGKDDAFYYHVSENLYARFFKMLPPFDFLEDNPKSLFFASSIEIRDKENQRILQFGADGVANSLADTITDSFVRLLVDANRHTDVDDISDDEIYEIQFLGLEQERVVTIYSDGYRYKDRYFQSQNIGEKVRTHINSLN